jgi:hypothetical protein
MTFDFYCRAHFPESAIKGVASSLLAPYWRHLSGVGSRRTYQRLSREQAIAQARA